MNGNCVTAVWYIVVRVRAVYEENRICIRVQLCFCRTVTILCFLWCWTVDWWCEWEITMHDHYLECCLCAACSAQVRWKRYFWNMQPRKMFVSRVYQQLKRCLISLNVCLWMTWRQSVHRKRDKIFCVNFEGNRMEKALLSVAKVFFVFVLR